jgi:hypothetical protein
MTTEHCSGWIDWGYFPRPSRTGYSPLIDANSTGE